ncbi:MAG: type II secretion system F family protein [Solidesulfovibrio sp.]
MAFFGYTALNKGQRVTGALEAANEQDASLRLRRQGLLPLTLEAKGGATGGRPHGQTRSFLPARRGIGARDVTKLTRQLASLLSSGLPLARSLSLLARQSKDRRGLDVIDDLGEKLRSGAAFSEALAAHPHVFDPLYVAMIKAGEAGGRMEEAVERLAGMREASEEIASKFKGALVYPAFMFLAMTGAVTVLVTFVVPRFGQLFADMGQTLPLPTQMLLDLVAVLETFWWLAPAVLVLGWLAFRRYAATKQGRFALDAAALKLPVAGRLLHELALSRACRTLGGMLASGVPLLTALAGAASVAGNAVVARTLETSIINVQEGKKLGDSIRTTGGFTPYAEEMAAVGEESGSLDAMMLRVADTYDRDTATLFKGLTSLLEPLMILIMGAVVAFIVLAMLLPIFQMNLMAG